MIFKKLNLKFYVVRSSRQCKTQIHLQDDQTQKYKLWNVTWISNNKQLTQKVSLKF
jgi:hypothetical protein